jgi:hypothetical protein
VHGISYEDLIKDHEAMKELLRFLKVDDVVPSPLDITVKQTREPLRRMVTNYDDIKFFFKGTKIASSFEE